ncbi:hypothetical protein BGZ63DRAFT_391559 [Mariannaea sp. PMI_226]|nr:hypothetical protein BGZ63DRAFT_391559 [Mariannaea sp. PMI_226]
MAGRAARGQENFHWRWEKGLPDWRMSAQLSIEVVEDVKQGDMYASTRVPVFCDFLGIISCTLHLLTVIAYTAPHDSHLVCGRMGKFAFFVLPALPPSSHGSFSRPHQPKLPPARTHVRTHTNWPWILVVCSEALALVPEPGGFVPLLPPIRLHASQASSHAFHAAPRCSILLHVSTGTG